MSRDSDLEVPYNPYHPHYRCERQSAAGDGGPRTAAELLMADDDASSLSSSSSHTTAESGRSRSTQVTSSSVASEEGASPRAADVVCATRCDQFVRAAAYGGRDSLAKDTVGATVSGARESSFGGSSSSPPSSSSLSPSSSTDGERDQGAARGVSTDTQLAANRWKSGPLGGDGRMRLCRVGDGYRLVRLQLAQAGTRQLSNVLGSCRAEDLTASEVVFEGEAVSELPAPARPVYLGALRSSCLPDGVFTVFGSRHSLASVMFRVQDLEPLPPPRERLLLGLSDGVEPQGVKLDAAFFAQKRPEIVVADDARPLPATTDEALRPRHPPGLETLVPRRVSVPVIPGSCVVVSSDHAKYAECYAAAPSAWAGREAVTGRRFVWVPIVASGRRSGEIVAAEPGDREWTRDFVTSCEALREALVDGDARDVSRALGVPESFDLEDPDDAVRYSNLGETPLHVDVLNIRVGPFPARGKVVGRRCLSDGGGPCWPSRVFIGAVARCVEMAADPSLGNRSTPRGDAWLLADGNGEALSRLRSAVDDALGGLSSRDREWVLAGWAREGFPFRLDGWHPASRTEADVLAVYRTATEAAANRGPARSRTTTTNRRTAGPDAEGDAKTEGRALAQDQDPARVSQPKAPDTSIVEEVGAATVEVLPCVSEPSREPDGAGAVTRGSEETGRLSEVPSSFSELVRGAAEPPVFRVSRNDSVSLVRQLVRTRVARRFGIRAVGVQRDKRGLDPELCVRAAGAKLVRRRLDEAIDF